MKQHKLRENDLIQKLSLQRPKYAKRNKELSSENTNAPIQPELPSEYTSEFHTLKKNGFPHLKQHRINSLERELDKYKDPKPCKAQGSMPLLVPIERL